MGSGAICQNLSRRHDRFRVSEFDIHEGNNIFSSKGIYGKKETNDKFTYLRLEYIIIIPSLDFTHCKNGHQGSVGHFSRRIRLRGTIPDIAMLFAFQSLKYFFSAARGNYLDPRFFLFCLNNAHA